MNEPYEMPTVRRIHYDNGSDVDPPLDPGWDWLQKLCWHAAVVAHDTGLRVRIGPGNHRVKRRGKWREVPGMVTVRVGASSTSLHREEAWHYLNGVDAGFRAAQGER